MYDFLSTMPFLSRQSLNLTLVSLFHVFMKAITLHRTAKVYCINITDFKTKSSFFINFNLLSFHKRRPSTISSRQLILCFQLIIFNDIFLQRTLAVGPGTQQYNNLWFQNSPFFLNRPPTEWQI